MKDELILVSILKEICKQKRISQADIVERNGISQPQISRIFSLKTDLYFSTFIRLCDAAEVNFYIEDKEGKADLNLAYEKAIAQLNKRLDKISKNNDITIQK